MKKRDISLDYIRIIAIFMIVLFHFCCLWDNNYSAVFVFHKNGTYGSLGTSIFFVLSGYLLRRKYSSIGNVPAFYKKRWISIFPPYYIAFIVAFIFTVIRTGSLFYQGKPYTLLFTLFGMDNLVQWYGISSYALVGEWFTGVIVILYILFPVLNKIMNVNKWTATVVYLVFFVISVNFKLFRVSPEVSLVSCGFIFWLGMMIAEYSDFIRKSYITGIIALAVSVALLFFVNINFNGALPEIYANFLMAVLFFTAILVLLKGVPCEGKAAKPVIFLSNISYCIYITHHFILVNLVAFVKKTGILGKAPFLINLLVYMVMVMVASVVLYYVSEGLIKLVKGKK